jgi:hypothetical protein
VQVAQIKGQAEQVVPVKKNASWHVTHAIAELQLAQGSEQAIQLGELRKYPSEQEVHVYPDKKEQTVHPAGQGSHPSETK